jgi:hypothetical protein
MARKRIKFGKTTQEYRSSHVKREVLVYEPESQADVALAKLKSLFN